MTATEIKEAWNINPLDEWEEFNNEELERTNLSSETKEFLRIGFPGSAPPCLSFGLSSFGGKFNTIDECYDLDQCFNKYLIFGGDGAGNPICFDTSLVDMIVLLDHEDDFKVIDIMNGNISELAECLLAYKRFIQKVQTENGQDAFLESNYTDKQYKSFRGRLEQINPNLLKESSFWRQEVRYLLKGIKNS